MTTTTVTLPNAMKHTSTAIPTAVFPGATGTPNQATCWHCHTSTGTTVSGYANGKFHAALTNYKATPTSAVTALAQPTACLDCHAQMRPPNIVAKADAGVWLQPMDHAATFTGGSVSGVPAMDCGGCHKTPGLGPVQWSDGKFHPNVPAGATVGDCVTCHYPLMTTAAADAVLPATGTLKDFAMKHKSTSMTTQACASCHTQALNRSTATPVTTGMWNPGTFHATVTTQPATCLECHTASEPTAATQGTVRYTFNAGGSSTTNSAQWMNHTDTTVAGKDCASCHRADARTAGSAWNKATAYHSVVTTVTACTKCHGTGNGLGSAVGTNNNLPSGLTTTTSTTTSSVNPGLKDQLSHADLNVTSFDCAVCHTQKGPSTAAGVQGVEWKQAKFHSNFNATRALVMNTTTARCSNCHLNVKPAGVAGGQDHAGFTATSGSQDCSACHSLPGTGTASAPNWKGAAGFPTYIAVGGFTISRPPATSTTTQTGIANLPHPPVATGVACTTCHPAASSGHRNASGYPHTSSLIASKCNACHEAGTDLLAVTYSSTTRGDSRAVGNQNATHFYPVDCKECHGTPSGNGAWTSASASHSAWKFNHTTSKMTRQSTCNWCH
jgi:hypothetical protein